MFLKRFATRLSGFKRQGLETFGCREFIQLFTQLLKQLLGSFPNVAGRLLSLCRQLLLELLHLALVCLSIEGQEVPKIF